MEKIVEALSNFLNAKAEYYQACAESERKDDKDKENETSFFGFVAPTQEEIEDEMEEKERQDEIW